MAWKGSGLILDGVKTLRIDSEMIKIQSPTQGAPEFVGKADEQLELEK